MKIAIDRIRIADRIRQDMGDVKSLAKSIGDVGLLHPIVLDQEFNLIAGRRRLEAHKLLKRESIEVTFVDLRGDAKFRAEVDENTEQKRFTPSEIYAIRERFLQGEIDAAKKRKKRKSGRGSKAQKGALGAENLQHKRKPADNAKDRVARIAGVSSPTLDKITVVMNAYKEDPERYGDIVKQMDETGKIAPAFRKMQQRRAKSLVQAANDGDTLTAKQENMVPRFRRLEQMEKEGVTVGSVWDIPNRLDYAGDTGFHGNCSPQVVESLLLLYSDKSDLVLDPMAGSATTLDVCRELERKCIAFDLTPTRDDLTQADAKNLPLEDESVDFVFWHPPYWNLVKYGGGKADLSSMSWSEFIQACSDVIEELARVLRKGKNLAVLAGDKVQDGKYYAVTLEIELAARNASLDKIAEIIKPTYNARSKRKGRTIYAEAAFSGNLVVEHDRINIYRKGVLAG